MDGVFHGFYANLKLDWVGLENSGFIERPPVIVGHSALTRERILVSSPASYVAPGRPRYPKDLSTDGRKVFKRLCRLLEERRTLTDADGDLIRLYAIAYQRHIRACEHLEQDGEIVVRQVTDKEGNVRELEKSNPWLAVAERAEKSMLSILNSLG